MAALVAKLKGDATLSALLGATAQQPKLFPHSPPSAAVYPCITYYLNTDIPHKEISEEKDQTYNLDIWSRDLGLNQDVKERLDALLTGDTLAPAGRRAYWCECEFATDLTQTMADGSTLYHKVTRWRIKSVA